MTTITNPTSLDPKIVVALDYADANSALNMVRQLDPTLCKLKVGKELFTAAGPAFVEQLVKLGYGVFLDLKFHDIPTTVAKACEAASKLGIWMLNVHASGGQPMMEAAKEGVMRSGHTPKLIAVTVLTSMDQNTFAQLGVAGPIQEHVLRLASLTKASGLDGVVCSAQEATLLRQHLGHDFLLVTPGIRPLDASLDDQSRVVTPEMAIANGASYLVIGRPITKATEPLNALQGIHQSLTTL